MDDRYDAKTIEERWQRVWEEARAWHVPNPDPTADRSRKAYVLEMLPYPSGTLHMGHVLVYTIGDVLARFRRRQGWTVLHPIGFDSFGLPAENAAIREGGHPREITERNIAHITREMKRMGWSLDWDRVMAAHTPEYYRWTQWLFLRLYEAGLAYRKAAPVKWCPRDQAVLANEQVHDGRCEYCGAEVEARNLEQWFFRTTRYADELLDALEGLDWPERVKAMQRNWIGRSEGAEVLFRIEELDRDVPVFTTRPDTLYGATFFVLAPEHPLVEEIAARMDDPEQLRAYVRRAAAKRGEERAAAEHKTGVSTGFHAVNPVNGERIPIWVADYVLMDYGTGAIMAVPGHDRRDFDFARAFGLPVVRVVEPAEGESELPYESKERSDRLVNSGRFDGLPVPEAQRAIVAWLAEEGRGREAVSYRLRDWGFSRQRYWGCPIPIVYCERCGEVPVPDEELPVLLPELEDYRPQGIAPLAGAEEWVRTPCPRCGGEGRREVETMDTFVDSSWYFLRYCDARNDEAPFKREIVDWWCPVDQYIGGIDHTTMHMIYARFFMKALNDIGLVGFREPFQRFFTNGWVQLGGTKMSKSKGNVIGPDELLEAYGADPVRLYVLFIGPADEDMEWTDEGIEGMVRFVRRLYRLVSEVAERAPRGEPPASALTRKAHETIAKVTDDIGRRLSFNTAIAAVMELVNELQRAGAEDPAARFAAETAVSLIQPYAPHVAEELWQRLGHERLWAEPWPEADPALLTRDTFELVVQVNGKVRDRIQVEASLSEDELVARAKASPKVQAHLDGGEIRKTIVVPRKLVNFVL
ncbi:MAG: leucine--tRNA ligase [Thermoleophilia bacterium]|nr:leucine--tRNA ligase [Thermoleophilia bacterium]